MVELLVASSMLCLVRKHLKFLTDGAVAREREKRAIAYPKFLAVEKMWGNFFFLSDIFRLKMQNFGLSLPF